jgi:hypothetical protein
LQDLDPLPAPLQRSLSRPTQELPSHTRVLSFDSDAVIVS